MLTLLIKFIGLLSFNILITSMVTPVEQLKKQIGLHHTDEPTVYMARFIRDLINCCYCFGFWFGYIVYGSFWTACIVSLSTYILNKLITNE